MKNAVTTILFTTFFTLSVVAQSDTRPNIILILADDLGWSSLSCAMDKNDARTASDYYETPHLARLAKEGMRFTRGYASAAICSPSRRSILFGQTPARLGDETFPERYDPRTTAHKTIPMALKAIDSRYKTAHYGKWDIRAGFFPEDAGYDESDGNTGNRHGNVFTDKDDKWSKHFMHDDPKMAFTLTDRATNFMQRQVRAGNPFYLQVSHYATHVDIQTREKTYQKYTRKKGDKRHNNPGYAGMLEDLDTSIGAMLAEIDRLGIAENTYVVFMADNGGTEFLPPVSNRLDHPAAFDLPMRNFPLRGGKWTLFEGGIRVPFIVKGPGIKADSQCDVPVVGWDLLPTFCALAGERSSSNVHTDGGSFAALLRNGGKGKVRRQTSDLVFHRYHNTYPHSAIISGDDKVIKFWKTGKISMFDLKADPGELNDLAPGNSGKAEALLRRMVNYLDDVNPGLMAHYK